MFDQGAPLGFVALLHDLSFVQRREETMRRFLLAAFGVLAACASVVTVVAARLSWRSWSNEMPEIPHRRDGHTPEFQPVMQDVRDAGGPAVRGARHGDRGPLDTRGA